VSTKQWEPLGQAATLVEGNDGECTAATGFPVHGDVLGVGLLFQSDWGSWGARIGGGDLDEVGVPSVLGNAEVIVALFLRCDMSKTAPLRVISVHEVPS
jgi:hypothetical protein